MNTLIEKLFGVLIFTFLFVPFQVGMYNSYMQAWEFTQVNTEIAQQIKEDGGYITNGSADKYLKTKGLKDRGYRIVKTRARVTAADVAAGYKENGVALKEGQHKGTPVPINPTATKVPYGDTFTYTVMQQEMKLMPDGTRSTTEPETSMFLWNPVLEKANKVTVYRR